MAANSILSTAGDDSLTLDPQSRGADAAPADRQTPPADSGAPDDDSEGSTETETVPAKRYTDAQRKITEMGQANAELRGKVAAIEDMLRRQAETGTSRTPANDPLAWLKEKKLSEAFEEDPSGTFQNTVERLVNTFGEIIGERDQVWGEMLRRTDPSNKEVEAAQQTLMSQEWFQQVPPEGRREAALGYVQAQKALAAGGTNGGQPTPQTAPGGKSSGAKSKKPIPMNEDPRFIPLFRVAGGSLIKSVSLP